MNESRTGQGAPDEATSRATSNRPGRRAFTLAEIIDAFMAAYAGADRGIVTRLAFWKDALGTRDAAEITPDDVADALAELAQARGRTYLGRDKATGERIFKPRGNGPLAPATVNRYLTCLGSAYRFARRRRLLPRGFTAPTRGIERARARSRALREAIRGACGALNTRKLGRLLRRIEGRELGGYAIERCGEDSAGVVWLVKPRKPRLAMA